MTEEKNINATTEQDKFADEVLTDDELENVAGGVGGKMVDFGDRSSDFYGTTGKLNPRPESGPGTTGK